MGMKAHMLEVKGPHARSQRQIIGDLEDDAKYLAQPSHAKQFSQEGKNIFFLSPTSYFGARDWWWCFHSLTHGRFEEDGALAMRILHICLKCGHWRPTIASPTPTTCLKWKNVL
jgi:hypothetical protein